MKFEIIKMQPCHIEHLARIEKECFSTPWSLPMLEGELYNDRACYFVALSRAGRSEYNDTGPHVAGYAGMHRVCGEGYITNVAVPPAYRRQGAAKLLLNALIAAGRAERLIFISLDVRETNIAAVSLYESFGFKELGRRKNYYTDPVEDALLLTLFL